MREKNALLKKYARLSVPEQDWILDMTYNHWALYISKNHIGDLDVMTEMAYNLKLKAQGTILHGERSSEAATNFGKAMLDFCITSSGVLPVINDAFSIVSPD